MPFVSGLDVASTDVFIQNDKPTPLEVMFEKLSSAFGPYLLGDEFPSNIKECSPKIDKAFIQEMTKRTLLSS